MTLQQRIQAAEQALAGRDVDGAARALLEAWREAQHDELAEAVERFPSRAFSAGEDETPTAQMNAWLKAWGRAGPLEVAPLLQRLDAVSGSQLPRFVRPCLDALIGAPADPRIGRQALRWCSGPLQRVMPKQLLSMVWKHASPRDLPGLERLATAPGGGRLKPVMKTVLRRKTALKPLDTATRSRVLALGHAAAKAPLPKAARLSESELLERVRAAPEDTSTREVFADWLLGQGDPWGELIALQLERARTQGKQTPRERTLLKEVRPRILGTLAGLKKNVLDDVVIERGFLVGASVRLKGVTRAAAMMARPEMNTLESVTFVQDAALTPNLRVLREAHGVTPAALKKSELKLEVVTVDSSAPGFFDVEWWPELKELYLGGMREKPLAALRVLAKLPVLKQLSALGFKNVWSPDAFADWSWETIDSLSEKVKRVQLETMGGLEAQFLFARSRDGWDVTVAPLRQKRSRLSAEAMPWNAEAVRRAKRVLKESKSVTFAPELKPELREALG